jgi:hypothetical protein
MVDVKFAAVLTIAVTAVPIGNAQSRPPPQKLTGVAIRLARSNQMHPSPS